jgi:TnpA family transposase
VPSGATTLDFSLYSARLLWSRVAGSLKLGTISASELMRSLLRSDRPFGALGLVVNVLVLWNTRSIEAALNPLRSQGGDVKPEDVTRLSPLEYL